MSGGSLSHAPLRRLDGRHDHARGAWVLASDLAARTLDGDVRKVVQGAGKVGRGSDNLTAEARKIACYLAMVVAEVSPERLAQASGLNRATIHKHGRWVEDRRDDPAFDRMMDELELSLFRTAARIVLVQLGLVAEGEA